MPTVDRGVVEALAAFGARPADLEVAASQAADTAFEVYPENWEAVRAFVSMTTQWRMTGISGFGGASMLHTGLDYSALEPVFRLLGVKRKRRAALFQQIRVMEEAALEVLLSD
ncbi:hypothetical protein J2785_003470 [Burkholderia ambifaria]|nr:DUF1799 domain-containing protein [Burkholderia ambifaria]MDR6500314.1 hypothetical protein [Burkholderia ambifaria]